MEEDADIRAKAANAVGKIGLPDKAAGTERLSSNCSMTRKPRFGWKSRKALGEIGKGSRGRHVIASFPALAENGKKRLSSAWRRSNHFGASANRTRRFFQPFSLHVVIQILRW